MRCWGFTMSTAPSLSVSIFHSEKEDGSRSRRAILAGIVGNVMEWYDFAVYGYFAAIIGRHFFPAENPVSSLLAAFGVFAAGFLMRPVGSIRPHRRPCRTKGGSDPLSP